MTARKCAVSGNVVVKKGGTLISKEVLEVNFERSVTYLTRDYGA